MTIPDTRRSDDVATVRAERVPHLMACFTGLAAVDLRGVNRPVGPHGALADVCGLPVLLRTLLLFQRGGCANIALLVHPSDRPAVAMTLARHPRVGSAFLWIEDAGATLRPLVDALEPASGPVLYWPARVTCGLALPPLASGGSEDETVIATGEDGLLDASVARVPVDRLAGLSDVTGAELVRHLSGGRLPARIESAPWLLAIQSADDVSRAEARLLASLRKDVDGPFAWYSRYASLAITRRLARFRVTPNQATLAAGFVGISAGALAAHGGYWWLLAGAVGYLASNVLDGVDGEIARVKLMSSRFGEWLDTVADDMANLSFTTGTAIGSYRTWHQDVYLVLGVVIAAGLLASASLMYRHLVTVVHSGDLNAVRWPWQREPAAAHGRPVSWVQRLQFLVKRAAFGYMAVAAALAGQAWLSVWLAAFGANLPWVAWAGYTLVAGKAGDARPG